MPRILFLVALLTAQFSLPTHGAAESVQPAESDYLVSIERVQPMDTTGLDSGLATVLRNYYQRSLGGLENWQLLESLRFDGTLQLPQGALRFTAFKKKPNLCKVVIYVRGERVVMSYDGRDAWQLNTLQGDGQPMDMPPADALNFIRDATTTGHLLYPLIAGKTISLLGTADVEGQRAYHLHAQLPDGQEIQYFLDMTTFKEIRQIVINNVTGAEEVTTHSDFRTIEGIRIPFTSVLTIGGKQVHQSQLDRVQVNLGLTPWMFKRPAVPSKLTEPPPQPSVEPLLNVDLIQPNSSFQSQSAPSFFEVDPLTQ
ncbi:hypothetical protein QEH59_08350 [Coraliomargarita sp. SDUM461004]|uniref:Outer membrane lipoprotein-sorting protein n=1 Tax=Thalassobacterium sedimentorum TaxID=3041258 RepID=A0ABU1AII2_9BACT|nr:hypothetical protein [Coraliomargarita sp. SDUM461004]MDQ8194434.1 hypothetical protein [Coraliomargarita sp. SDUM461004]